MVSRTGRRTSSHAAPRRRRQHPRRRPVDELDRRQGAVHHVAEALRRLPARSQWKLKARCSSSGRMYAAVVSGESVHASATAIRSPSFSAPRARSWPRSRPSRPRIGGCVAWMMICGGVFVLVVRAAAARWSDLDACRGVLLGAGGAPAHRAFPDRPSSSSLRPRGDRRGRVPPPPVGVSAWDCGRPAKPTSPRMSRTLQGLDPGSFGS